MRGARCNFHFTAIRFQLCSTANCSRPLTITPIPMACSVLVRVGTKRNSRMFLLKFHLKSHNSGHFYRTQDPPISRSISRCGSTNADSFKGASRSCLSFKARQRRLNLICPRGPRAFLRFSFSLSLCKQFRSTRFDIGNSDESVLIQMARVCFRHSTLVHKRRRRGQGAHPLHGYIVGKDRVRSATLRGREMFVPLTHATGEAQADFGQALAGDRQRGVQDALPGDGSSEFARLLRNRISGRDDGDVS
jgi:hypothetical protein